MTPVELLINARMNDKYGWDPFQSQAVKGTPQDYIAAGGAVHKLKDGKSLCGNIEGVGFTNKNTGITCVNCRRKMVSKFFTFLKKGKAS